jgi:hypothetical protein
VKVRGKYVDEGYLTSKESEAPPFLPFLIAVVLGIVAATVVVVSKTG